MIRVLTILFTLILSTGCSEDFKDRYKTFFKEEILLHCVGKRTYYNDQIPFRTFEENEYLRVTYSKFVSDKRVWVIERDGAVDYPKEKSTSPEIDFEQKIGVTDRIIYNYVISTDKKENTYLSDREDIDRLSGVWTRKTEVTDLKNKKVSLRMTLNGACEKSPKKF